MQNSLFKQTTTKKVNAGRHVVGMGNRGGPSSPSRWECMEARWGLSKWRMVGRDSTERNRKFKWGTRRLTTQPEHKKCREQRSTAPAWHETSTTNTIESSTIVSVLCFSVFFYFVFNLFNDKAHYHGPCYRKCIDIFLYLFRHRYLIVRVYVIGGDIPSMQVTCKGFHTVDFGGDSEVAAFRVLVSIPVYSSLWACQNKLVKNTFMKS